MKYGLVSWQKLYKNTIRIRLHDVILCEANNVHLQYKFNFRTGVLLMHMGRERKFIIITVKLHLSGNFKHFINLYIYHRK